MTVGQGSHRWALLTQKGPLGTVIQRKHTLFSMQWASRPGQQSLASLSDNSTDSLWSIFSQRLSSNSHFPGKKTKPMLFCSNSDLSIFPRCFSFLHLHPDQVYIMSCLDHHTDLLSSYLYLHQSNTWYITVIQTNKNIIISQPCLNY